MSSANLPVIDIADIDAVRTRTAIDTACREWGFFQIVGHGIEERLIAALRPQMRAFFAQPLVDKQQIVRTAENPWGFYDRELTRNTQDWKQIYDYGPPDGGALTPQWPAALPLFKPAIQLFYAACSEVAQRLLRAMSINLGMPGDSLDEHFGPSHTSFLRLNYYPKCPTPQRPTDLCVAKEGYLGVNQHTDAGAITLLLQDEQPGLEVFNAGKWQLIEPRQDAFVVNIGDIAQVWSNDRYRAALHRGLANADAERFSIAFFLNPTYSANYAPLPSTIDARHPPRYRSINWGEFRARRAAGDYANDGEYHQIDHYRRH
ncbi:MAG TPA: 2OG-Fe(II) oxygenase family protein [Steroidobacteraceae bacterium]|jgi:isopenicillin N synthase-like dioxygenase